MNASLLWNSVRKDARFVRVWILIFIALGALPCLWPLLPPTVAVQIAGLQELRQFVQLSFGALAGALLIQMDFPRDVRGFLRTRPLNARQILAAKLTVLACFFVIPAGLLQAVSFYAMGFRLSVSDAVLAAADYSLFTAVILSLALIPALLVRQIGYFVLIAMGIAMAASLAITLSAFNNLAYGFGRGFPEEGIAAMQLGTSRTIAAQFVIVAGSCLTAWSAVRFRTALPAIGIAIASLAMGLVCWKQSLWNFTAALAQPTLEAPSRDWPNPKTLTFKWLEHGTPPSPVSSSESGSNGKLYRSIGADFIVSGLPPGWDAQARTSENRLLLSNGKTSFERHLYSLDVATNSLLRQWKGEQPRSERGSQHVDLVRVPLGLAREFPNNARLSGEVTVQLLHPRLLADLPLRRQANFTTGRRSFTITRVEQDGRRIEISVDLSGIELRWRGEDWSGGTGELSQFELWNPKLRESAKLIDRDNHRQTQGAYWLTSCRFEFEVSATRGELDASWLADAQFRILGAERSGTTAVPFDFHPINLLP
jgi:ABC-type transport system involved in multi-copper enzyme maturation permease subunit